MIPDSLSDLDRSPDGIIRFFETHGRLPFAISGGDGTDDDGEGDDDDAGDDDDKGGTDDKGKGGKSDDDALTKALEDERKARKDLVKANKDLQRQLTALKNAGKPEADQLKSKVDELEQSQKDMVEKLQEKSGRAAVIEAAMKAGSARPEAVYRLVKEDLEFNDDYDVTNVDALVAQAKKDTPELFKSIKGKGDGGNQDEGGRSNKSGGMNSWIRKAAGRED